MSVRALLLDADGNLFPSEEPAFVASADVTNALLAELGSSQRYDAEELRRATTGMNFRTTAAALAAKSGRRLEPDALERWVTAEKEAVTDHLRRVLTPDDDVLDTLRRLAERYELAAVSSSALSRLDGCFAATGLAALMPPERRFSAEDSLPRPASKPDPAVYLHALEQLELRADEALAVEDSPVGARAAVAAGIRTVGNLRFVAAGERAQRTRELLAAGAGDIIETWAELEPMLAGSGQPLAGTAIGG
ncbi:MAG: hypothetical protein QOF76_2996 [Solirubrobacteraceae bacterium]|nr:hypothetical protein [Solirubrobacteraceae bacterium]